MTVYRVEHARYRNGPYRDILTSSPVVFDTSDWFSEKHPLPNRDGIQHSVLHRRLLYQDWKCGYGSLEQVRSWFTPSQRTRLQRADYHLAVFHVRSCDVLTGYKQVIFKRDAYEIAHALELEALV